MIRPKRETGAASSPVRRLRLVRRRACEARRPAGSPLAPKDYFFCALDGREIELGRMRWRVDVYCVYVVEDVRWVQVSLEGVRRHVLTLKLPIRDDGTLALRLVESWLSGLMIGDERILTVA